jgi:hypothetical protein
MCVDMMGRLVGAGINLHHSVSASGNGKGGFRRETSQMRPTHSQPNVTGVAPSLESATAMRLLSIENSVRTHAHACTRTKGHYYCLSLQLAVQFGRH